MYGEGQQSEGRITTPNSTPPNVSVIIVNYNGRHHLESCLTAVQQQDVPCEIVLVDNDSRDDSVAFVRQRFPQVKILELDQNLGFAEGNNFGARSATGDYFAFLNNDTCATSSWIRTLVSAIDEDLDVGCVASRIVYLHDPSIVDSAGDGLTRSGGAFKYGHGCNSDQMTQSREVFGACGAAFLVRKDLFDVLGGFDKDFFVSHEDVDLSYRLRLLGYKCLYIPKAVVMHAGSATLGRRSFSAVFHSQRNLEWLYLKNTPWPLLVWTFPGHLFYVAVAAAYFCFTGLWRPFLSGKWAALRGIRQTLRKRFVIQQSRKVTSRTIWAQMEPRWFLRKFREKRFDLSLGDSE